MLGKHSASEPHSTISASYETDTHIIQAVTPASAQGWQWGRAHFTAMLVPGHCFYDVLMRAFKCLSYGASSALENLYMWISILQTPSLTPYLVFLFFKCCLSITRQAPSSQSFLLQSGALCVLITMVTKPDVCFSPHTHTVTPHAWFLCYLKSMHISWDSICLSTTEHRASFYCKQWWSHDSSCLPQCCHFNCCGPVMNCVCSSFILYLKDYLEYSALYILENSSPTKSWNCPHDYEP